MKLTTGFPVVISRATGLAGDQSARRLRQNRLPSAASSRVGRPGSKSASGLVVQPPPDPLALVSVVLVSVAVPPPP